MSKPFRFIEPYIPSIEEITPHLQQAYELGHFTNFGPACKKLEHEIENKFAIESYNAITVTNATAGLQIVLSIIDVRDKYVVIPDFTFPATFQAVLAAGGIPILCDIDLATSELDYHSLKDALDTHDNVAAVIHVRCFGIRRDVTNIIHLCHSRDIPIVFDSAAGLGDVRQGKYGSDYGEFEVFSLHTTKVFAAGEGGVILTPNTYADKLREATNFGLQPDRTFVDGINAKMDEFRCAVGLATLNNLSTIIDMRTKHVKESMRILSQSSCIDFFQVGMEQTWSNFPIFSSKHMGDELQNIFEEHGIITKRYYYPLMSKGYKGLANFIAHSSKNAEELENRILCIPVYSRAVEPSFFTALENIVESLE